MKRCSSSLIIREAKFSASMRYLYTLTKMVKKERSDTAKYRQGCRTTKLSHIGLKSIQPLLKTDSVSVQFSSVAQSCPTLCNPMNCSTPGLPVHHQLPEFTQTHVYRVSDAIQPSHPLSSPSPPAPNPS